MDENLDVVPFLLKVSTFCLEQAGKTITYLLSDVRTDFLDIRIALQIATANVQRNIRTVYNTMQQCQELRNDALDRICYEYLVAVQLNFVALHLDVVLDFGEVENIAVLPFSLLAKSNGHRQEVAVLAQQAFHLVLFEELKAIVVDVHNDAGTTICLVCFLQCKRRTTIAAPLHSRSILVALGDDVYLLADHEGTVEAKSEVTNNSVGIVLVLVQEVIGARECNLVDVLLNLVGSHTNTTVGNCDGLGILVNADGNLQVAQLAFEFALAAECLQLLRSIYGIADNLT